MPQRLLFFLSLLWLASCADRKMQQEQDPAAVARTRAQQLKNTYGTYGAPPRLPNGRVNQQQLLSELKDIHATTYHWLIWQHASDWDDLQAFLPLARKQGLKVWVTVVPPSESRPIAKHSSEPFQKDYKRWAEAFARLSLQEPNLVAWSIDDFVHNLKFFTRGYMDTCLQAAKAINPRLAFVPCAYFRQITPQFAADYGDLLDGILFPYRAESGGANLTDASLLGSEIAAIRKLFRPGMPVFVDIYATAHSRLGPSSPEYVQQVLALSKQHADGVLIYCHQDPAKFTAKYNIIREGFNSR